MSVDCSSTSYSRPSITISMHRKLTQSHRLMFFVIQSSIDLKNHKEYDCETVVGYDVADNMALCFPRENRHNCSQTSRCLTSMLSISQSAFTAIGGYFCPSFSTFGSHVHHFSELIAPRTLGMWLPQPHQDALPKKNGIRNAGHLKCEGARGEQREEQWKKWRLTASRAGCVFAHLVKSRAC